MTSSLSSTCAKVRFILQLILAFTLISSTSFGQELPADFVTRNVASGAKFELPVGIAFAPNDRIFVAEKKGKVYVIDKGQKISEPFIDLENEVLSKHDQGLLGIAVDPDFEENRWVYLLYVVDPTGGRDDDPHAFSRLTRYKARSDNLNEANKGSRQVLLGKDWRDGFIACSDQHVIGSLRFARDGTLLVSAGEAGVPGIPDAGGHHPECFEDGRFDQSEDIGSFRSQFLGSLAGKILRIDPETGFGLPSNPYYNGHVDENQSKVWAYGLRNPFRFGIRPNGSPDADEGRPGSVYIGDVGWNQYEDLNVSREGGENFGWPCYEGPEVVRQYRREAPAHSGCDTIGSPDNPASHSLPLVYWHHTDPNKSQPNGLIGSSVTGGAFYLGNSYPVEYRGGYFFADFVEGWMKVLKVDEQDNLVEILDFATLPGGFFEHGIVDIQSHPGNGDIHYVDITAGEIVRMIYTGQAGNQEPIAIAEADTMWGHAPLSVRFIGSESYDPDGEDLTYLWQFGTGDTAAVPDPVYIYASNGDYSGRLRVTDPQGASSSFILKITVGSLPPLVSILSPEEGFSVFTDERVLLEGEATDPDEPETNLKYEWVVDVHHNTHLHPSSLLLEGKVATLVPGNHGDPWDIIYLEAKLKVTDSSGLTSTAKRYVVLKIRGEDDITDQGSPIVLVTDPTGDGNKDIEVIRDGVFPAKGSEDVNQQYDTFRIGEVHTEDWIGYEFSESHRFSKVIFQEGIQFPDGGWFETLMVQIRQAGVWKDGFFLNSIPQYPGGNGVNYETYTLLFTPESGDAIRIKGLPGGSSRYVSVAELRVVETPFQPPPAQKLVLTPTDDARIRSSKPDFNYGTSTEIRVREASGVQKAYLKFSITGLVGTITSAKLRLFTNDGGPDGGTLYQVSNNLLDSDTPWDEVELNYFNAPRIDGTPIGTAGPVEAGNWVEFDVGTVVLGNGVYSFGLKNASADMVEYSSKEGARAPELVIEREVVETFPPEIASFDPQSGLVGTEVTIFGEHFSGYTDVLFGGVTATVVTLDSDDRIRALVPEGAVSGRVSVLSPTGTTVSATDFTVVADDTNGSDLTPQIVSFTPDRAPVGTVVEIRGRNFAQTTAVRFDSVAATFTVEADSVLHATIPEKAVTGKIYVTTDLGTSRSQSVFTVEPVALLPEIRNFVPASGLVGSTVMISGLHLAGTTEVMFDNVAATFELQSDSTLLAIVPGSAATGKISVRTQAGMAISGDNFIVDQPTSVSGFQDGLVPHELVLNFSYPNPFNLETTVEYGLPKAMQVRIEVYNLRGQAVRRLVDAVESAGFREISWDGRDELGQIVSSGIYFIRLRTDSRILSKKITLQK